MNDVSSDSENDINSTDHNEIRSNPENSENSSNDNDYELQLSHSHLVRQSSSSKSYVLDPIVKKLKLDDYWKDSPYASAAGSYPVKITPFNEIIALAKGHISQDNLIELEMTEDTMKPMADILNNPISTFTHHFKMEKTHLVKNTLEQLKMTNIALKSAFVSACEQIRRQEILLISI